ncbi:hypothetical protein PQ472_07575 [Lacticaseibacillus pabuli]|uniref:Uncharacterized protein n=1 Tax=Lacticaseibacillus pabuli TaxID=3025672 RepID=A0ABY7WPS7_9LACO|nr:hypothetical protein [Lacticaseibacillus sp. KACC 23028]WDF81784.1 hypothetical protein PQ472_07575 [Lacticaseibacillus sp. KACC 23028]
MVFIAILLDALAVVAYFIQVGSMSHAFLMFGTVLQVLITVALFVMAFYYRGRRRKRYWMETNRPPMTVGFIVIVVSGVLNALVAILYICNVLGINHLIFSV